MLKLSLSPALRCLSDHFLSFFSLSLFFVFAEERELTNSTLLQKGKKKPKHYCGISLLRLHSDATKEKGKQLFFSILVLFLGGLNVYCKAVLIFPNALFDNELMHGCFFCTSDPYIEFDPSTIYQIHCIGTAILPQLAT